MNTHPIHISSSPCWSEYNSIYSITAHKKNECHLHNTPRFWGADFVMVVLQATSRIEQRIWISPKCYCKDKLGYFEAGEKRKKEIYMVILAEIAIWYKSLTMLLHPHSQMLHRSTSREDMFHMRKRMRIRVREGGKVSRSVYSGFISVRVTRVK